MLSVEVCGKTDSSFLVQTRTVNLTLVVDNVDKHAHVVSQSLPCHVLVRPSSCKNTAKFDIHEESTPQVLEEAATGQATDSEAP